MMDDFQKEQKRTSPQREAIERWERRRRLRPLFGIGGLVLLSIAYALRHTAGIGKFFCIAAAISAAVLLSLGRSNAFDARCPVCGHLNVSLKGREYHCKVCGFDHYDF